MLDDRTHSTISVATGLDVSVNILFPWIHPQEVVR